MYENVFQHTSNQLGQNQPATKKKNDFGNVFSHILFSSYFAFFLCLRVVSSRVSSKWNATKMEFASKCLNDDTNTYGLSGCANRFETKIKGIRRTNKKKKKQQTIKVHTSTRSTQRPAIAFVSDGTMEYAVLTLCCELAKVQHGKVNGPRCTYYFFLVSEQVKCKCDGDTALAGR